VPDASWTFGEQPLAETRELAELMRSIAGHALALEQPTDALRDAVSTLRAIESELRNDLPPSLRPRIGALDAPDRRVYLDHSRHIGAYNPCVPVYELTCGDERADGSVEFPIVYEGPPGMVHGGFLAMLFDCVLQQLSCDLGATGSTSALEVRYRRPTPLRTRLRISATREVTGARITSRAQLHRDDELLCEATMTSAAIERDALPEASPRRAS
jgi:hypothetical protein